MTHSSLFVTYLMIILNITNALVVSKNCIATFDREDEGWAGLHSECKSLDISGNYIFASMKANPKSLMDAITKQCPKLESMSFIRAELHDHDLTAIAEFVGKSKTLESLSLLENQEISDVGARNLAKVLGKLNPVTSKFSSLDLSGSIAMTDEAVRLLASSGDRSRKCFKLTVGGVRFAGDVDESRGHRVGPNGGSTNTHAILHLSNAFCDVVDDYQLEKATLAQLQEVADNQARSLRERDEAIDTYIRDHQIWETTWLRWSWLFTVLAGVALGALASTKMREASERAAEAERLAMLSAKRSNIYTPTVKTLPEQSTLEKASKKAEFSLSNLNAHAHIKKKYTDHYTGLPVASLRSTIIRDVKELNESPRKAAQERYISTPMNAAIKRAASYGRDNSPSSPSKRARTPIR
jgi:hypothetical protein